MRAATSSSGSRRRPVSTSEAPSFANASAAAPPDAAASARDPDDLPLKPAHRILRAWYKRRLAGNEAMLRERLRRFLKTEHFWTRPLRSSDLDHSTTSLP